MNNHNYIKEISNKVSSNIFDAKIANNVNNNLQNKKVFFKYSPLIDPIKYITGKYHSNKEITHTLPTFENKSNKKNVKKFRMEITSAYVDSFFSYLTSQLLNHHDFTHLVLIFMALFLNQK